MKATEWLSDLLRTEIDSEIYADPRTVGEKLFGCPRSRVFNEVINGGQAEFGRPTAINVDGVNVVITARQRALLYAMYNQPRHLDELVHAFAQLTPAAYVARNILDIGCGPFTAGLAYAKVVGPEQSFRYYGVDRAPSMLELAQRLFDGARSRGGVHAQTRASFSTDLAAIEYDRLNWEQSLAVVSYLLASPTVDAYRLAVDVGAALDRMGRGPQAVLHINSAYANGKYPEFKRGLLDGGFTLQCEDVELFTDTQKNHVKIAYALFSKPKQEILPMGGANAIA